MWKSVPGFVGLYEVSDQGEIKSFAREVSGRVLRQANHTRGYKLVTLCRSGRRQHLAIHRLVMAAFVGPCPADKECAHLDGNVTNNFLSNLTYVTHKENCAHKKIHGTERSGERALASKLSQKDVQNIREVYVARCPANGGAALANKFGVTPAAISCVVRGKTWQPRRPGGG